MTAFWALQAQRINALTLRERAIMFVSLAVAMAAAADALVLSPRLAERKAVAAAMRQQSTELDGLRAKVAGSMAAGGPASPQGQLKAVRAERQAVEAELLSRSSGSAVATGLPELLERVLKRHERLTLLRLATAAPAAVAVPVRSLAGEDEAAALPQLGVDLSLSGSYPDLAAYLAEIEDTLPGVRWSDLEISSQTQPPVLKLRVFLIGNLGAVR